MLRNVRLGFGFGAKWAGSPHELGDGLDELIFAPVDLGPEAVDCVAGVVSTVMDLRSWLDITPDSPRSNRVWRHHECQAWQTVGDGDPKWCCSFQ